MALERVCVTTESSVQGSNYCLSLQHASEPSAGGFPDGVWKLGFEETRGNQHFHLTLGDTRILTVMTLVK